MSKVQSSTDIKTFHCEKELSPAGGIVRDGQGRIFVSDEFNHRIIVYNRDFLQEKTFGKMGDENGEFHYPRGLALDGDGNLYVADAWNHRVVVFDKNLSFKTAIGKLGTGMGELDEPVSVVWVNKPNGDGCLAVLEKSNHRVQFFGAIGTPPAGGKSLGVIGASLGAIGARGSTAEQEQFYLTPTQPEFFCTPVFEFPSAISADSRGNLYVADTNNHRIVKITPQRTVDTSYVPLGLKYPVGTACDEEDNLHVTCFNCETVSVFSPDGILLYRYAPKETELPVTVAISDGKVYLGAGMTACVSLQSLQPKHEEEMAGENIFWRHFKTALSLMRDGDSNDALTHLEQAADATEKPTALEFADALPENDYAFRHSDGDINAIGRAEKFGSLLEKFSEEIFCEIEKNLERKIDGVDKYAEAALQLENSIINAGKPDDTLQVARFRSIKKVFSTASELKNRLAGFKKLQELWQRFSYCGFFAEQRLAQIKLNFERFTKWKQKREQWYESAEKEAPSLSFNSLPGEHARFAQNEALLDMLGYEFRVLWSFASDQNRELAELIRRQKSLFSPLYSELILTAVDFSIFCPDDFTTRLDYMLSLEDIFDSAGADNLEKLTRGYRKKELLDLLGREDNIPQKTGASVYRLLPVLWGGGKLECDASPPAEPWDKIVDFYHSEFRRFVNENSPLRTEFLRSEQMLPTAEKADVKQAIILGRKLGLLRFHNYFQERYIGNIMAEYLVRFALFALKNSPITKEQAKRTEKELDKLIEEIKNVRLSARDEIARLEEKVKSSENAGEKRKLVIKMEALRLNVRYSLFLIGHLALARKWSAKVEAGVSTRRICGADIVCKPFDKPAGVVFDGKGKIYATSHGSGLIFVFDESGRFLNSFAGYGNNLGNLMEPVSITITPDGGILVAQITNPSLSLFSPDGVFIRRFVLEEDKDRQPYQTQFDSTGRLFVSFMDGDGLSVYDLSGKLIERINPSLTAQTQTGKLRGFCVNKDRIFIGGNGNFLVCDILGNAVQTLTCTDTSFENIASVDVDNKGNLYALVADENSILVVDSEFKKAIQLNFPTRNACRLAVGNGLLALSDYASNAVWLSELPSTINKT